MRLFVAIRPPDQVVDHLALATAELRHGIGAALRWAPPEQWHLTCAFLGEVPDGAVPIIADSMAASAADHEPLTIRLHGAGNFSGRTLWIGVAGDTSALTRLMADCADHQRLALPNRPEPGFTRRRAHVTLARVSARARDVDLRQLARVLTIYDGPTWTADRLELIASSLGRGKSGGPLHEVLATARFASRRDAADGQTWTP